MPDYKNITFVRPLKVIHNDKIDVLVANVFIRFPATRPSAVDVFPSTDYFHSLMVSISPVRVCSTAGAGW